MALEPVARRRYVVEQLAPSRSAIHVGTCTPLVIARTGPLRLRHARPDRRPHRARDLAVQLADRVDRVGRPQRERRHVELRARRRCRTRRAPETVAVRAERAPAAGEMLFDEIERKRVVAGRHRRVRREHRRAAGFPRARRRTMTPCLDEVADPLEHDERRRALRSGGRPPAPMPSAFSARTPPMPRMISCWTRVSRSPPYRRADSSRSHGAFSSRSVSSRYSFTRPSRTRQTATSTAAIAERHGDDARLAVGRDRRLDRRVGPVQPLVALLLPAFGATRCWWK